jgi:glycopeptide antibiotics resistance protein
MPPEHQLDVPALPVLLPLGFVLMAVSCAVLHRRRMLTAPRLATAWAAGWYLVAVIGATLLPLHLAWGESAGEPEFYRLVLVPLTTMRVDDFVLNIAMTLPLAAVLHLVLGIRSKARVVFIGFLLSFAIEVSQAILNIFLHGSRWADVNDLMSNTLGAFLGYLLFRRLMRAESFRRSVEKWSLVRSEARTKTVC